MKQVQSTTIFRILTWMALSLCQDRHRLFSMIGTRTLWSMLVPVLPKELSVLPHPATTPTLPTRSTSWAGRQMGKILSWYSTGRSNLSTATSNRSGWVNMYRKSGCKVIWSTLKDSEPRGSLTCKEKLNTDFHFVQKKLMCFHSFCVKSTETSFSNCFGCARRNRLHCGRPWVMVEWEDISLLVFVGAISTLFQTLENWSQGCCHHHWNFQRYFSGFTLSCF